MSERPTTFELVVGAALDRVWGGGARGKWPVPRDLEGPHANLVATHVLAFYAATAGLPVKLVGDGEGLTFLEAQRGLGLQRPRPIVALGASRILGGLWTFELGLLPPVRFWAALACFEPRGVLWRLWTEERLRRELVHAQGRQLLLVGQGGELSTDELVAALHADPGPDEEERDPAGDGERPQGLVSSPGGSPSHQDAHRET